MNQTVLRVSCIYEILSSNIKQVNLKINGLKNFKILKTLLTSTLPLFKSEPFSQESTNQSESPSIAINNPPVENNSPNIWNRIAEEMNSLDTKYVLMLVSNFAGNPRDLHKFVTACEIIHTGLREQDVPRFLQLIKLKLDGKAYDLMKYKTLDTWENLKKLIEGEFTETRSIGHLQMEMSCLRQGKAEDVKSYANRLETLLHDLNEACIKSQGTTAAEIIRSLNSNIALKSFQEGLDNSIKIIVKACRFENLNESINRAMEEELTLKHSAKIYSNNHNNNLIHNSQNLKYCQFCKRLGHRSESCHSKLNSTYNNTPCNSRTINSVIIHCAYCKKPGHKIQDCFRKKRSDSFKINQNYNNTNMSSQIPSGSGNVNGLSKPNRGTP